MSVPSIKRNYIFKILYEILIIVAPLITAPYIARVLGADGVGTYSFSYSVITYFTLFAALGTISYGTREIAQHRDDKYQSSKLFWEIELMTVGTTAFCLVIWGILVAVGGENRLFFLAWTPQLLATAADISWFYTGQERIGYTVFWNSVCRILGVVLIFLLVRTKADVILYILLTASVHLFGNLSMWIHLKGFLVQVNFRELRFKHHFHETLVYFVPAIASTVYTVLDKTLIGLITNDSFENGYYEQATRIILICKAVAFTSVNTVMSARISYLFADNRTEEIRKRIGKSMNFIMLLGFGCVGGLISVSKVFVPLFFGPGYEPVVKLLYFMSPLIIIIGVSNCLGYQYYTPSGQRRRSAKYVIIGAITNLCMSLMLIPGFGAIGATIGSIIAELVITVLYLRNCNSYMTVKQLWNYSWKRIISAFVMAVAVYMIGSRLSLQSLVVVCIQVSSGVVIYGVMLLLLRDDLLPEMIRTGWNAVGKLTGKKSSAGK